MLHTNPYTYTVDPTNKYGLPLIPDKQWEPLFAELGKQSIGLLLQLDPTHSDLYTTELPKTLSEVPKEFKDAMHELMAGCFDPQSKLFSMMTRNVVVKYSAYLRFLMERRLYSSQISSTPLLSSLFVLALPRSGSTFLHTILSSDSLAETMAMYEHLSPGGFTMTSQSRKNFGNQIVSTVHSHTTTLNEVHALVNAESPEEELFFLEQLGHSYLFSKSVPRLEIYREMMYKRNYQFAYDQLKDHLILHQLEFHTSADKHFVMKGVSHFIALSGMLQTFGHLDENNYFVWIHREPVDEIKSLLLMLEEARGWYSDDIGFDDQNDRNWMIKTAITANLLNLKNALAIRDSWIAENPKRAKKIIDVGFKETIAHPVETVQRIYSVTGMNFSEDTEKKILEAVKNDPQKKFGKKQENPFKVDEDEIRQTFKFYYDRFSQFLPNYWGPK